MSIFSRRGQRAATDTGADGFITPPFVTVTSDDQRATLWWTAVATADGYAVEYKAASSGSWLVWPHNSTVTHAVITGLQNGTTYHLRVRATRANESTAWSGSLTATPIPANVTQQGLPTTLETVLVNNSNTNTVYAYIIGLDMQTNRWTMVTSDGHGTYAPPNPFC